MDYLYYMNFILAFFSILRHADLLSHRLDLILPFCYLLHHLHLSISHKNLIETIITIHKNVPVTIK